MTHVMLLWEACVSKEMKGEGLPNRSSSAREACAACGISLGRMKHEHKERGGEGVSEQTALYQAECMLRLAAEVQGTREGARRPDHNDLQWPAVPLGSTARSRLCCCECCGMKKREAREATTAD